MVMWYNHKVGENGLLGEIDPFSLHGGCDVQEGYKWVGNHWIPAPETIEDIFKNRYLSENLREKLISSYFD